MTATARQVGIVSLKGFGLGLSLGLSSIYPLQIWGWLEDSIAYLIVGLILMWSLYRNEGISLAKMTYNQVRLRAFFLGWGVSFGSRIIASGFSTPFGLYICILSVFHFSEFLVTSFISPETLSLDSFLLNHSKEYGIAACASVCEFLTEFHFIPWLKTANSITILGIVLCVGGELIRKCAMITASKNFTHLVRERKVEGQYLVTGGPYAICRHPGYAGWFWWSIGTQLVMVNPICLVGYFFAVLSFFKSRIYYEEICLISFFGLEYVNYRKEVPRSGVPFVEGYVVSEEEEEEIEDFEESKDEEETEENKED